jgi:hypothetical protein
MRSVLWHSMSSSGTDASTPTSTVSSCLVRHSRAHAVSFTERPESFHRPLAWRSHLPVTRRWRNDSKYLPSCRDSLPASADSSGVSARQTQRLSALDRVKHRAVPVTFWHDARAPIHSNAGITQRLCGPTSCSGHDRLTAPRYPSGLETGFRRPRQRILRFAMG